jgi:integrase/recombinase XerD
LLHSLAAIAIQFLDRPGLAKSTQQSYELTLMPLLQRYGRFPIETINRVMLEEYLNSLTHLSYTTHHRHQAVLQSLLNFAVKQEYLKSNPIAQMQRRKPDATKGEHTSDQVTRYLTPQQLALLYNVIIVDCRLNAVIHLLHRTGARIAEILALNLEEIDLEHRKFQVVGKGNKTRWCFYSKDAEQALEKYLRYYRY